MMMRRSPSLVLILLVVLAVGLTPASAAVRPELSALASLFKAAPSAPAVAAAALATPTVRDLVGCYYSTRFQLQCTVGVTITVYVLGLSVSDTAVVSVGSSYTCGDVHLNVSFSKLTCTLPTSIAGTDYGTLFPVTVTTASGSSAPFGSVEFLQQPVLPTVTKIAGCAGGSGDAAIACRTGQVLTLSGTGFYQAEDLSVSIGPYSNVGCWYNGLSIILTLPAFAEADLAVAFPVTVTINGASGTYTPGLSSYGALTLTSVTGCASTSGPATDCEAGDVITLTGSGFNLGNLGDRNTLGLVWSSPQPPITVLSNTEITLTLPTPPFTFSSMVALTAGVGMFPVRTPSFTVRFTPHLIVAHTFGGVVGCDLDKALQLPSCNVGNILVTTIAGGDPSTAQSITILAPSGSAYTCGSLYLNKSYVQCTVPQVSSSDLGQVLGVTVTAAGQTSTLYSQGLIIPLA